MWCYCHPKTPSSLASFKSRLILPFWYRHTQVVLEKRLSNRCSSSSSSSSTITSTMMKSSTVTAEKELGTTVKSWQTWSRRALTYCLTSASSTSPRCRECTSWSTPAMSVLATHGRTTNHCWSPAAPNTYSSCVSVLGTRGVTCCANNQRTIQHTWYVKRHYTKS